MAASRPQDWTRLKPDGEAVECPPIPFPTPDLNARGPGPETTEDGTSKPSLLPPPTANEVKDGKIYDGEGLEERKILERVDGYGYTLRRLKIRDWTLLEAIRAMPIARAILEAHAFPVDAPWPGGVEWAWHEGALRWRYSDTEKNSGLDRGGLGSPLDLQLSDLFAVPPLGRGYGLMKDRQAAERLWPRFSPFRWALAIHDAAMLLERLRFVSETLNCERLYNAKHDALYRFGHAAFDRSNNGEPNRSGSPRIGEMTEGDFRQLMDDVLQDGKPDRDWRHKRDGAKPPEDLEALCNWIGRGSLGSPGLDLAFALGGVLREFRLHEEHGGSAKDGQASQSLRSKGGQKTAQKKTTAKLDWYAKTVEWVQCEIDQGAIKKRGRFLTKDDIAEHIEKNWDNRGFVGAPATGKCPSRSELTQTYIPKWKKHPFNLKFGGHS